MNYSKLLKIILVTAVISSVLLIAFYYIAVTRAKIPAQELARFEEAYKKNQELTEKLAITQARLEEILSGVSTGNIDREAPTGVNPEDKIKPGLVDKTKTNPIATTSLILYDVPFTSQAPFFEWDDPMQQDGCEEAASLMAVRWARGQSLTLTEAKSEIIAASEFELRKYGEYRDTAASTTAERILGDYFNFKNYEVKHDITVTDIISELQSGNILITPMNGQALGNPNYTAPGPDRHMLVVRGYDPVSREFITNDNGTRRGEEYRYNLDVFYNSIRDYPSGFKVPIKGVVKAMIVIRPEK